ncbi:PfkB family carbohydrate kinase [Nesterenkonia sp. K-15-9-6]|uniref:PfkB family carbohydrate kinase n=1 Tax=Nesterenkonia sp. K-15-9-6 TaxID=3093918 RepID=UPI0040446BBD
MRPAVLPDVDEARCTVEELVCIADVVKTSDEDLRWLYPDRNPLEVAAAWRATGPAIVIVTLGGEGRTAVTAAGVSRVSGKTVQVIDTVGAGDTFMGALIHGLAAEGCVDSKGRANLDLMEGDVLEQILEFVSTAAAVTVSRPGADPPRLVELTGV